MPLKVKITHWHAVAIWKWVVKEEDCGICRQAFDSTCPSCLMPGDECPPVWGKCNHHFHMHCIMKWLQQQRAQDRCPLCRQPWEIKTEEINDNNNNNQSNDDNQQQQQQPQQNQRPRRQLQLD
mmetsp:Transcript_60271/g.54282  ORF Transcript_60271/g.54282 Transcript_60271/m.54282 type:complete len:123 (+) Transcript_60271:93-461(+)